MPVSYSQRKWFGEFVRTGFEEAEVLPKRFKCEIQWYFNKKVVHSVLKLG